MGRGRDSTDSNEAGTLTLAMSDGERVGIDAASTASQPCMCVCGALLVSAEPAWYGIFNFGSRELGSSRLSAQAAPRDARGIRVKGGVEPTGGVTAPMGGARVDTPMRTGEETQATVAPYDGDAVGEVSASIDVTRAIVTVMADRCAGGDDNCTGDPGADVGVCVSDGTRIGSSSGSVVGACIGVCVWTGMGVSVSVALVG